jgi:hypothetical protein
MPRLTKRLAQLTSFRAFLVPGQGKRGPARFRPTLEPLERRDVPSLVINPTFDSSITSDPNAAKIEGTIKMAIQTFENTISNSVTVGITFKEMSSGLGQSNWFYHTVTYSAYLAALKAHATSAADNSAIASLPAGPNNPVNGDSTIRVQQANAVALGLEQVSPTGTISLNTSICNLDRLSINPNKYDLLATVAHEIDEVLGFASALNGSTNGGPTPTGGVWGDDLYRYGGSGVRSFNTSISTQAFYSINGGTTDLAQFNQSQNGDFSDWFSTAAHTPRVQDAFATPGAAPNLGVELTRLDVLGYTLKALTAPVVTAPANQVAVAGVSTPFNLGSFTETNPRGPWHVIVSWGDGAPNTSFYVNNTGKIPTRSHKYAHGTFTAKVTVVDFTNRAASKTFQVGVALADTASLAGLASQEPAGLASANQAATGSGATVLTTAAKSAEAIANVRAASLLDADDTPGTMKADSSFRNVGGLESAAIADNLSVDDLFFSRFHG